ncbi:MAG: hypothetical protein Q8K75_09020 [Chlamydiales bacterium]|nr:hypothetical protein [Chlamydiales bacterium]
MSSGDSIFSIAGNQGGKGKPKPKPELTPAPVPRPIFEKSAEPMDDEALDNAFRKVREMQDDLERNLDNVYAKTGWNKSVITSMLDNPGFYKDLDTNYESAQHQRQAMKGEIDNMVGAGAVNALESREKKKEQDRTKRKTLGSRRNWLNMH